MDEEGNLTDPGELSGIDKLLLALAARYGPEAEELCLYHLKVFFADLKTRDREGWGAWMQRFFMVFADAEAAGLALNIFGPTLLL